MSNSLQEEIVQLKKHIRDIETAYSDQEQCATDYSQWAQKHISELTIKYEKRIEELQEKTVELQDKNLLLEAEIVRLKKLLK